MLKWTNSCRSLGPKQHAQTDHFNLTKHTSGDVLESRSTIVYVPSVDEVTFQSEPCAVEWGEGHVDIGAQRRFDTRPDYFFSFYWDDQIPTQE